MDPKLFTRTGQTRTSFHRDHALIASDGHVLTPLPNWNGATGVVLISPVMGARFAQTLVFLEVGVAHLQLLPEIEAVIYVLEGEIEIDKQPMTTGSYGYLPAGESLDLSVQTDAKLMVFEKRFSLKANKPPRFFGHESEVEAKPFLGDPDARLQVLLPENSAFDMAVNVFSYQPGATLPFVETHVMEHGLWMLDGAGIYRLNQNWYPVAANDCIWMAPFCPQWFAATGKIPARYLYYKDVNRDAMEGF